MVISVAQNLGGNMQTTCLVYAQHYTDDPGVSTNPGASTTPGQTDNSQLSSNTGLVAGAVVTMFVLVLAAVCIVFLVVWCR